MKFYRRQTKLLFSLHKGRGGLPSHYAMGRSPTTQNADPPQKADTSPPTRILLRGMINKRSLCHSLPETIAKYGMRIHEWACYLVK